MKVFPLALCGLLLSSVLSAESTRTWVQTKYEDYEKGTAHGVAINSDGSLTLAPAFKELYTSPSTYIWDAAADADGNVYAAAGSPARVYKVTPAGKASIIFAAQELEVQALAIAPDGTIYAATSPDGKVYKIVHGGPAPGQSPEGKHTVAEIAAAQEGAKPGAAEEKPRAAVAVDASYSATVLFDPHTKYIWALQLDKSGQLYVGTGDRGQIFRVDRNGNGACSFKATRPRYAVSRWITPATSSPALTAADWCIAFRRRAKPLFCMARRKRKSPHWPSTRRATSTPPVRAKTRSRTIDSGPSRVAGWHSSRGDNGAASGSAVGKRNAFTCTFVGSRRMANLGGSEVYRISPDGSPRTLWSSKDDLVYALAFDASGRLLAGTGNKGKIYVINGRDYTDMVKASANQVTAFARAPQGGMYAATSNLGKIFQLGPGTATEGTYESDVFDARIFSQWGRVEARGTGKFDLYVRSGNVDNPDRNWSGWKKVDTAREMPPQVPSARYVQWKAVLFPDAPASSLDTVTLF